MADNDCTVEVVKVYNDWILDYDKEAIDKVFKLRMNPC
ncbi:DUF3885 domain-containing protein [Peribacillus asahii]|uniref:DUF3885 domain-containing protein n=1 Tax=Peribacillus asahii TaxID=228899 RepID=A0A398BGA8_9BACI|nr:DUF3885 domain-containing protein [Peribacillus asahii]